MPAAIAMGQVTGTATAMAVRESVTLCGIVVGALQDELKKQGTISIDNMFECVFPVQQKYKKQTHRSYFL